jgi:hypothetical protein
MDACTYHTPGSEVIEQMLIVLFPFSFERIKFLVEEFFI